MAVDSSFTVDKIEQTEGTDIGTVKLNHMTRLGRIRGPNCYL